MTNRCHRPYPPDWLSAESAAYALDIGMSTLYALIRAKRLPQGVKIGGNVRWCRETLLAAMDRIAEGGFDEIDQADDEAVNDDEIMGAARGNGTQANVGH